MKRIILGAVATISLSSCGSIDYAVDRMMRPEKYPSAEKVAADKKEEERKAEIREKETSRATAEFEASQQKIEASNAALLAGMEKQYKMKVCEHSNLLANLSEGQTEFDRKCMYVLVAEGYFAIASQTIAGGVVVSGLGSPTLFLKTKKHYADGTRLQPQYVRSIGLKSLPLVTGATATLNGFQYVGDALVDDDGT